MLPTVTFYPILLPFVELFCNLGVYSSLAHFFALGTETNHQMRKQSNIYRLIVGLGLIITLFVVTFSVQAQSRETISDVPSILSTADYLEAEQVVEAIADELYKAYQLYPDFSYSVEYKNNTLIAVTVTGIDNHTIANRIANQIIVLEDIGRAIANMDMNLLPELPEMTMAYMLNEQQVEAYQPNVDVSMGFTNVLHSW